MLALAVSHRPAHRRNDTRGHTGHPTTAGPLQLELLRFTNYPGSVFTTPEDDPTAALILVESGEVTVRLAGPVTITHTTGSEEVAAETEFTLLQRRTRRPRRRRRERHHEEALNLVCDGLLHRT